MKLNQIIAAAVIVGLSACGQAPEVSTDNTDKKTDLDALTADAVKQNAQIAYAVYQDSVDQAIAMHESLKAFVAQPTEEAFAAAKQAWLASREPYGQSEVYRFRLGPIDVLADDGTYGTEGDGPEGRINAWPLGEAIIDYIAPSIDGDEGPESPANALQGNLIANVADFPIIDKALLKNYFEHGEDERNVTTGYHAIEFLLWGQDLNQDGKPGFARDASPGQRPLSDFLTTDAEGNSLCTSGPEQSAAEICERRGDYLLAASELLISDLKRVADAWHPKTGEHYKNFVSTPKASLAKILEGMGRLSFGELAGERINIALSTDSQEDEHSCFSDNTHRDILLNALGVQNSYLGTYTRVSGETMQGVSIQDLLTATGNQALADELATQLATTMQSAQIIDKKAKNGEPFDVLIQQGVTQADIRAMIAGLIAQTDSIERAISVLQLTTGELRQDTEQDLGV